MKKDTAAVAEEVKVAAVEAPVLEEGFEGLDDMGIEATVTSLPFVSLLQALSPAVSSGEVEGARAGLLINSMTSELYGQSLEVIVYRPWRSRCIMPPREEGSFPICSTLDMKQGIHQDLGLKDCATCELKGISNDSCRDQYWFIVAPANDPSNLMRMNMWKSSAPAGRKLLSLIAAESRKYAAKAKGIYQLKFKIESKKVTSKTGNVYYVFDVSAAGMVDESISINDTLRPTFHEASALYAAHKEHFDDLIKNGGHSSSEVNEDDFAHTLEAAAAQANSESTDEDGAGLM